MFIIGLTGGILSGKSTIAAMLADRGAVIIDADRLAHDAYRPRTDTWKAIVAAFGDAILSADGEIDRSRLADIVFADRGQLDRLNAIVHPPLRRMVQSELQRLRGAGAGVVVLEAAVLVEAGWSDLVDEVWVASAPVEVAVQRLQGRAGLSQQ